MDTAARKPVDSTNVLGAHEASCSATPSARADGPAGIARAVLLSLIVFFVPAVIGGALTFSTIDVRAGIPWLGVDGQGQVVAPSPLMYEYGVSLPLNVNSRFAIVPEIDFFGTQYQLVGSGPRAIPTEVEYGSNVWMLGIVIDPAFRYRFPIGKTLSWGISASPSIILHVPTVSYGLTSQQIGTITSYLYSSARFFLPSVGAFFDWQMLPKIALEFRVRSFLPVFHLWDNAGLALYDQLMIDGTLGIRFALH